MNWDLILYLLENFSIIKKKNKNFTRADSLFFLEETSEDLENTVYLVADAPPARYFHKALLIYPGGQKTMSDNYLCTASGSAVQILNTLLRTRSRLDHLNTVLSPLHTSQEVIDAAGKTLHVPFFYFDSSYRVLAISEEVDFPEDAEWKHMKEKRYLSPESVKLMQDSGDLDILADQKEPFPYHASYYPFHSLVCNLWLGEQFYGRLNMLCISGPPTQVEMEECRIIRSHLKRIAESSGQQFLSAEPLKHIVLDLLRGLQISEELIKDRLSRKPQLLNSLVQVCCVEPNAGNDPQVLHYYSGLFERLFSREDVLVLDFDGKVVLILHAPDENGFSPLHQKLSETLRAQELRCSVSNTFYRFNALRHYYLQALAILGLRSQTRGQLLFFRDVYFEYLLSFLTRDQAMSMVSQGIIHLIRLQRDYQFPLTGTLKTYLECGCNLQMTADRLYIHKNTALYRINHIREILGLDLNDTRVRMRLLFSFQILEVFPLQL
ncbi:MAG: helix-turn-helix domain-containing protein [Parasporobacterium sp.]|nr:helix-turn-helix domain-containing protein [Parasporobacterium sp.]